jgi:ribosomal-protein-alanine N-acetyltransferase
MKRHHLPVLVTERLRLRPFRLDDWPDIHEYAVDPEISRYQDWGPNSVDDTRAFVLRCRDASQNPAKRGYFFSIARLHDDRHIGGCRMKINANKTDEASIGYTIGPKCWNLGFATEAAIALIAFGFDNLGLRRMTAHCDSTNVASWRVMEKSGMQMVGKNENAIYFKDQWRDWLEYAISEAEWRSSRKGGEIR